MLNLNSQLCDHLPLFFLLQNSEKKNTLHIYFYEAGVERRVDGKLQTHISIRRD